MQAKREGAANREQPRSAKDRTKTVPECNVFKSWGLVLSEKQIPQVVENIEGSEREWTDWKPRSCLQSRCSPN